ncbi:MAG TPA: Gfo/Idh/MocA family oxidoreductase [Chitinivibrionales bacterium]|nr:Gfo/Idh/MocA family oxidoreductase [Chitinivibrionales bacterium]
MDKVRVAVIGAGVLGSYHIQKCLKNRDVAFAGFFDVSAECRVEVAKKLGVTAWNSEVDLVAAADACIIAAPSSRHGEIAQRCMEAKKHVLVEKPLAPSYDEGAALVQLAKEKNVALHVGHSEAFNTAFVQLQSHTPAPRFIEVHRLAQYSPRGTDVSVILDLMVHDLQLVLRLLREEPVYGAIAATGVPVVSSGIDIANVRIPFASGCVVNCTASRISAKRMRKLRLFEKDNYYSVDLDKEEIEHYYLTAAPSPGRPLPVGFDKQKARHVDALEAELAAFVNEILGKEGQKGVTGEEALAVLKVTDTIMGLLDKK